MFALPSPRRSGPCLGLALGLLLAIVAVPCLGDELVLDMADLPNISECGEGFVLSGLDCWTQPLTDPVLCLVDNRPNDTLLLSYATLIVDPGELSAISYVDATVETFYPDTGSTFLGVYQGDVAVAFETGTILNEPEVLHLSTAGLLFDSIRISGVTTEVAEIRIESPDVPLIQSTWSAVKAAYR